MEAVEKRLQEQIRFILEIDRLKRIYRQNFLVDGSRRENDAEHSWSLAVMALVLKEYGPEGLDLTKVLQMVLLHDLVEIDAGDTFCYDPEAAADKAEREERAAERIFALLPPDQERELKGLWIEFEQGESREAKFAICLDRLQPLLNNYHTSGGTWRVHDVSSAQVKKRVRAIAEISPTLGAYALGLVEKAVQRGILRK
ncbi:MAG: HD domain-containing protein [Firmicutes bacterium]|nr:HD domain-containing protein [Bacillota bacterium]